MHKLTIICVVTLQGQCSECMCLHGMLHYGFLQCVCCLYWCEVVFGPCPQMASDPTQLSYSLRDSAQGRSERLQLNKLIGVLHASSCLVRGTL